VNLGNHYIALNVKDLNKSRAFYEKLGFVTDPRFNDMSRKWLIMRNGTMTIGLYQDMIPKNTITFNPEDIRELQKELKSRGIEFILEVKDEGTGPAHFLILDPDGNPLFFDQHK
jgi:lactoylglutathione lyase